MADYDALAAAAARHDVVVVQRLPGQLLRRLARSPVRIVFDLYNPLPIEVLEAAGAESLAQARRAQRITTLGVLAGLAAADFVICASERQRDLWLGGMVFRGLLDPARYRRDPSGRSLIDVVPFGVPDDPRPTPPAASPWPGVGPDDRVLVWGGGIWRWLDALTPIRAVEILRRTRDDVHLVFIGTGRPVTAEGSSAGDEAVAEAERLGLLGTAVHVNPGWTPYRERGALLAAADLGVSAHPDHLESRFAFRTRLLDYLWAGLPIVSTRGDALGDLVERRGLGAAPPPGDPDAFAAACARLLDDDALRERTGRRSRRRRGRAALVAGDAAVGRLVPRPAAGRSPARRGAREHGRTAGPDRGRPARANGSARGRAASRLGTRPDRSGTIAPAAAPRTAIESPPWR